MEFKVKEVGTVEEKSSQEIEENLLEKHEEKMGATDENQAQTETVQETVEETVTEQEEAQLKEEDVLSFIKNRYDKDINSVEDLFQNNSDSEELPQDVSAYLEYRKNTGRGFEDYLKLSKDFDSMDEDVLLKEYLYSTEDGLDEEDIDVLMEDYSYDEELDDESDIKKTKLAKKKTLAKAKKFFNEQKEMYKKPLESSTAGISESEKKEIEEYKQYIEQSKTQSEELKRKRDWFLNKTDELFNEDFKGFDFKIEDKKFTYTPTSDVNEMKKLQSDTTNFVKKFMNDEGLIQDVKGYHKSLSIAMNPERFAKFFYEQGKSEATDDVTRKIKNVNMSERKTPEVTKKDGFQVRSVNPDTGRGLKVKSRNKN